MDKSLECLLPDATHVLLGGVLLNSSKVLEAVMDVVIDHSRIPSVSSSAAAIVWAKVPLRQEAFEASITL